MGLFLLWPQFRQPAAPSAANTTHVLLQCRTCEVAAQWSHPCCLDKTLVNIFLSFLILLCFCQTWGGLCPLWVRCSWSQRHTIPALQWAFLTSNSGNVSGEKEHWTWGRQLEKPTGTSLLLGYRTSKQTKSKQRQWVLEVGGVENNRKGMGSSKCLGKWMFSWALLLFATSWLQQVWVQVGEPCREHEQKMSCLNDSQDCVS